MNQSVKNEKFEQEAKKRCAQFLLDMFQKYGAEVLEENKNMACGDAQKVEDKED